MDIAASEYLEFGLRSEKCPTKKKTVRCPADQGSRQGLDKVQRPFHVSAEVHERYMGGTCPIGEARYRPGSHLQRQ